MDDAAGRGAVGLPTLEDLPPVAGRRVLVRADLNAPLRQREDGEFEVTDDFRLRAAVPTLEWLRDRGAEITVCSHLGRPKGSFDPRYTMAPVRRALSVLAPGVSVLENLRFDPGEEANDPEFVRHLVAGFDLFVNDAFGACHRSHGSIVGPPTLLPSVAGRLLVREVEALSRVLDNPAHPFVAVVGGAKVADKLGLLRSLAERADHVLLGGAMCFTFLQALGHDVGRSPVEADMLGEATSLLDTFAGMEVPSDLVALEVEASEPEVRHFGRDLPEGWQAFDIGPETGAFFGAVIKQARTVLWNGPMGVFEDERFACGTRTVAYAVAASPGYTVAGGGETAAALHQFKFEDRIDHISSGGGATLEFLEKGDLPGLIALRSGFEAGVLEHPA